jgi:ABC-type nitrate/sulfonate/bicarbonate transport system substrate-binding protein
VGPATKSILGIVSIILLASCRESVAERTEIVEKSAVDFQASMAPYYERVQRYLPASSYVTNEFIPTLSDLEQPPDFDQVETLRVGAPWVFNDEVAAWFIANDLGFFAEAGLEVELEEGGPARNPITQLLSGKLDIAVSADSAAVPIACSSRTGGRVTIVSTILKRSAVSVITLDEDTPRGERSNRKLTADEMRGKTFGIQAGSERLAQVLLESAGLGDSVTLTRVGNSPELLMLGRVDFMLAWIVNQPRILEENGYYNWISFPLRDYIYSSPSDVSVVTNAFLKERPDLIYRYNWALQKSLRYIFEHPEEAAAITERYTTEAGLTQAQIRRRFELERPLVLGDDPDKLMVVNPEHMNSLAAYNLGSGVIALPE